MYISFLFNLYNENTIVKCIFTADIDQCLHYLKLTMTELYIIQLKNISVEIWLLLKFF